MRLAGGVHGNPLNRKGANVLSSRCSPPRRRASLTLARVIAGASAVLVAACGGGMPLLHPAHPLPSGVSSLSAGVGSQWVLGRANREVDDARNAASGQGPQPLAAGPAVAASLYAPGPFPWVSMRLGLGSGNEAGAAYTGHRARVDARHAWLRGSWAFSVGAGAGLGLAHPTANDSNGTFLGASEPINGLDTSGTRAVAFDVPILLGWRSSGDIARVWLGLRPSYEHVYGTLTYDVATTRSQADISANVMTTSGIIGLAMGLRPLFLAMELSAGGSFARGSLSGTPGNLGGGSTSLSAVTLTPAAALIWEMR